MRSLICVTNKLLPQPLNSPSIQGSFVKRARSCLHSSTLSAGAWPGRYPFTFATTVAAFSDAAKLAINVLPLCTCCCSSFALFCFSSKFTSCWCFSIKRAKSSLSGSRSAAPNIPPLVSPSMIFSLSRRGIASNCSVVYSSSGLFGCKIVNTFGNPPPSLCLSRVCRTSFMQSELHRNSRVSTNTTRSPRPANFGPLPSGFFCFRHTLMLGNSNCSCFSKRFAMLSCHPSASTIYIVAASLPFICGLSTPVGDTRATEAGATELFVRSFTKDTNLDHPLTRLNPLLASEVTAL
mmetsp:Transcript_18286/g.54993  ORF Transcript_18286/g.54993 Transcript_18286/m.54993 type:complete len:293 (-) Transcript_18286:124-1002(-)